MLFLKISPDFILRKSHFTIMPTSFVLKVQTSAKTKMPAQTMLSARTQSHPLSPRLDSSSDTRQARLWLRPTILR